MTVECHACAQKWARDPVLEVVCPTCGADVGQACRRPSGHNTWGGQPHAERDVSAMAALDTYDT